MQVVKKNGDDRDDHIHTVDGVDQVASDFLCTTHSGAHGCKYVKNGTDKQPVSGYDDVDLADILACPDWIALPA